jgi:sugar/nucleoside kinase (ribokinase family)
MPVPAKTLAPDALGPTVTVGEILVEIMATTLGDGFLEPIELIGPYPSGAPAIFIDQCARIGGQAGIVACVGNDDFGKINIDRLRTDGADVSAIAVSPDYPTGSAFVRYRKDGSRDFVYNIGKSAAGLVGLTPEAKALIARAGHLHVMGTAIGIP